jgi:uncharacterized protein with HEPN domain
MSLSPHEFIRHILDEIEYILSQLPGKDYESFRKNETLIFLRCHEKQFIRVRFRLTS